MAATLREEMSREEPDPTESESGYTAESDPHADPREQSPELAIVFKECGFWLQRGVSQHLCPRFSQHTLLSAGNAVALGVYPKLLN